MVRKAGIFALALLLAVGAGAATKKDYIDLIEQAVSAYTPERIADYIDDVHFAGKGVLTVRKDDAAGMYLIIK